MLVICVVVLDAGFVVCLFSWFGMFSLWCFGRFCFWRFALFVLFCVLDVFGVDSGYLVCSFAL